MKGVADRRPVWRPYFFEVLILLNFLLIEFLVPRHAVLRSLPSSARSLLISLGGYTVIGLILRGVVARARGEFPAFRRHVTTSGWLTDTLRLLLLGAVMTHTYFWIKLVVPVLHPRLFDQQMWDIDQTIGLGLSPNILILTLFSNPRMLQVIDWTYANIFFASLSIGFSFFLSEPSRRLRLAFAEGNTVLWLTGAWLYMAWPSVGPAFRFPDVWFAYTEMLPRTQYFQALLMRNYNRVLRVVHTGSLEEVSIMYGVAAFPSLHVAFQTYVVLWMRGVWIYGGVVFGVFLIVIFLGSVITGWHYLIDSIAGLLLAAAAWAWSAHRWRVRHWLALRRRPPAQ